MSTAAEPETESALIERLQQGDPAAYRTVIRDYSPGMLSVARAHLDPSAAEEVVQDC